MSGYFNTIGGCVEDVNLNHGGLHVYNAWVF